MTKKTIISVFSILCLLYSCTSRANPLSAASPQGRNFVNIIHIVDEDLSTSNPTVRSAVQEALTTEVSLLAENNVKATFFLQYDALSDNGYLDPIKSAVVQGSEAAGFWQPTKALAKKAGVAWKGESVGDMLDGQGFSTRYTALEREKMAATYMEQFRSAFGNYPTSVGSHYTDEHIIRFMLDKFDINGWFVCETERGNNSILNDGFEGIYYPNGFNASIPGQTQQSQLDIPVIRVARDDLNYLYKAGLDKDDNGMEPEIAELFERHGNLVSDYNVVYWGGYLSGNLNEPSTEREKRLAIFTTLLSKPGFNLATVSETAAWFKQTFKTTPAYAYGTYTMMSGMERPVIRYNSRFYSVNFVWDDGTARFRDIYKFDEKMYMDRAAGKNKEETRACYGLPLCDGFEWTFEPQKAGVYLMEQIPGMGLEAIGCREPREITSNTDSLSIVWKDRYDERTFTLRFTEKHLSLGAVDNKTGKGAEDWMMALLTAKSKGNLLPFTIIVPQRITAKVCDYEYHIDIAKGKVALNSDDTPVSLKMFPDQGTFELDFSIAN